MRGRKPTPVALKLLRGNPGKRPIRAAPGPVGDPPEAPDWLPAEARKKWAEIVPDLHRRGIVQSTDIDLLTAYVVTWVRWRRVSKELELNGSTVYVRGGKRRSPLAIIERQLSDAFLRMGGELGMTPQARVRLGVPVQPADGMLDTFLKARK